MARIQEFTSQTDKLIPEETGILALQRAGARIREDDREAGQQIDLGLARVGQGLKDVGNTIEQHQTMREIGQGAASYSALQANLSQQWNDTAKNADPNDPTTAQQFHDNVVQPALEQWQSQFHTKQARTWALERGLAVQDHMQTKTAADMSTLAGLAVHNNLQQTLDNTTQAVLADPTSHDFVKAHVQSTVDALLANTPNLSAVDQERVKTEITHTMNRKIDEAAFYTVVNKNPALAEGMLNKGKFPDIDPAEAARYVGMAKKQAIADARAARVEARMAAEDASEKALKGELNKLASIETDPNLSQADAIKQMRDMQRRLWQDPSLKPSAAMSATTWLDQRIKDLESGEKVVTDPAVDADMRRRLVLEDDDPAQLKWSDLIKNAAERKISPATFREFGTYLNDRDNSPEMKADMRQLNQALGGVKGFLTKSNPLQGQNDPLGDQRFHEYTRDKTIEFLTKIKAGVSPRDMLNPSSPQYLFNDIQRYQVTPQQSMDLLKQRATGGNPTPLPPVPGTVPEDKLWKPGETGAQYLKRIGAQ